jgi:hypothetical protein
MRCLNGSNVTVWIYNRVEVGEELWIIIDWNVIIEVKVKRNLNICGYWPVSCTTGLNMQFEVHCVPSAGLAEQFVAGSPIISLYAQYIIFRIKLKFKKWQPQGLNLYCGLLCYDTM